MREKFAALRMYVKIVLAIACTLGISAIAAALVYVLNRYEMEDVYKRLIVLGGVASAGLLLFGALVVTQAVRLMIELESEIETLVKVGGQMRGNLQGVFNSLKKIETAGVGKRKPVDTKELLALAEESIRPYELGEAQAQRKGLLVEIKNAISDKKWQAALDSSCLFVGKYPETEEAQGLLSLISKLKLKLGRCPQCDTSVSENQIRCPNCGYEFEEAKEPI